MRAFSLFLFLFFASTAQSKIDVKSTLPWMKNLGSVATCVLEKKAFQDEVRAIQKWDHSTRTGSQVVDDLSSIKGIQISTYQTKNPFSKSIAYTVKGSSVVYFNTRRNPRPMKEMINTVVHEVTHVVGYGHGDNSPKGKEKSVPYGVGAIAEKHVEGCLK